MTGTTEPAAANGVVARMTENLPAAGDRQRSEILFEFGPARVRVAANLSPAGLLSIAALVTGILLSTAVIVTAAGNAAAGRAAARLPRGIAR